MTAKPERTEDFSRLAWLCRRGMLELDLLFMQFLERQFDHLRPEEKQLFETILASTDQDLYAWLLKTQAPIEPAFEPLLQKIREYIPCKFN